uniref:Variant surface glycoprotein 1125.352 n=1 Tax=Trypanosoma brucei TaxID=5691 RepID=A0A1J0R5P0_9TRYP|nr:variant surface glycoprotein 1125.352 [Trypanosoma brucei]
MATIIAAEAAALLALSFAEGATKGTNTAVMANLCPELRLGDSKPKLEPQITTTEPEAAALYKLNMSLAPTSWQEKFVEVSGGQAVAKQKPNEPLPPGWSEMWDNWKAAALSLASNDQNTKFLTEIGLDGATQWQMQTAAARIRQYAEAAEKLLNQPLGTAKPTATDDQLHKQLMQAVYGQDDKPQNGLDSAKTTGKASQGYSNTCGGGSPGNTAATVAHIVACVCGTASSVSNEEPCQHEGAKDAGWEASSTPQKTKWEVIRNSCPTVEKPSTSVADIDHAIRDLTSAVTTVSTNAYIGNFKTSCDGTTANAACLKLNSAVTGGKADLTKIEPLQKLQNVAQELRNRIAYNNEQQKRIDAVKHLVALALAAVKQAKCLTAAPNNSANTGTHFYSKEGAGGTADQRSEKLCNAAKDDQGECDKLKDKGCIFKEDGKDGKKCTLSEEGKQSAQKASENQTGTDGKTNTTGSNSIVIHKTPFLLAVLLF